MSLCASFNTGLQRSTLGSRPKVAGSCGLEVRRGIVGFKSKRTHNFLVLLFRKRKQDKQGVENWIEEWGDHEHTESRSARRFEGGNGTCHIAWDRLCRGACRWPAGQGCSKGANSAGGLPLVLSKDSLGRSMRLFRKHWFERHRSVAT